MTYSEYPTTVAEFSSNNDELFTHLKRLEIGSHSSNVNTGPTNSGPVINGNVSPTSAPATGIGIPLHGSERYQTYTDLDDALYAAADMFKNSQANRRKIIFLISDGSNSRQNKHTFNETLRALLNNDISVYSISVSHTVPAPVGKSLVEHGLAELQKYATQTGGDTFYAAQAGGIGASLFRRHRRSAQPISRSPFNPPAWMPAMISIPSKFACAVRA